MFLLRIPTDDWILIFLLCRSFGSILRLMLHGSVVVQCWFSFGSDWVQLCLACVYWAVHIGCLTFGPG